MQVIGSTRKMYKRCSKETWPFPRCWWRKLDAEIAPRSSCVFRPLLPSLKSCRHRLKAQAEEAQRIMQAEYKSKQSHLNSLHSSRIKEVHIKSRIKSSFRHCSLVQIHFCFCNPQQVHYGIQEADEEQFQIFSDAVSIFFVLSEVIPALVGWCSSEATTCKYIMMHHVVLWHFMWNKLISSW